MEVATLVRIFDPNPTDDLVTKRGLAIKDIAAKYTKNNNLEPLLKVANDLAACVADRDHMPDSFANDVTALINKASSSFVRDGNALDLLVCALGGALQLMPGSRGQSNSLGTIDVVAAGLWSGLSFQSPLADPKLEELRSAVLERSRSWTMVAADAGRTRTTVPDITVKLADGADVATATGALKAGVAKTVNALRDNAALDREELDVLWWALGDWSTALNGQLSRAAPLAAAVVGGIELGALMRRLPADAHRHLVRRIAQGPKKCGLAEIAEATADARASLESIYGDNTTLANCPHVFPVLHTVVTGNVSTVGGNGKMTVVDWGARALLESSLLNLPKMLGGL